MIKTKSGIFEKAAEIKKLYEEIQNNLNDSIISMKFDSLPLREGLLFQIHNKSEFVRIAKENGKRFEVNNFTETTPYEFETEVEGIKFFTLANQEEYDYIINQLF